MDKVICPKSHSWLETCTFQNSIRCLKQCTEDKKKKQDVKLLKWKSQAYYFENEMITHLENLNNLQNLYDKRVRWSLIANEELSYILIKNYYGIQCKIYCLK